MKGSARAAAAWAVVAILGLGCTSVHRPRVEPEDGVRPVEMEGRPDLRVAVVFREADFPSRYESRAGRARFSFQRMRRYYAELMRAMFPDRFGALDFAVDRRPSGYDVYVHPKLRLQVRGDEEKTCSASVTITVVDTAGGRSGHASADGEYVFERDALVEEACKTALVLASTEPLTSTLGRLSRRTDAPSVESPEPEAEAW